MANINNKYIVEVITISTDSSNSCSNSCSNLNSHSSEIILESIASSKSNDSSKSIETKECINLLDSNTSEISKNVFNFASISLNSLNLNQQSYFELSSRIPGISKKLNLNINKYLTHTWGKSEFIYSSVKNEYQVKNIPSAHWGITEILIIGACPVSKKITQYPISNKLYVIDETLRKLNILINEHKITTFISLMAECDDENGNENNIHRPYSKLDLPIIDPTVKFFKLGIKDCDVIDDNSILEFTNKIVDLLANGEKIYLHCWGGHGRAGTVYCILLHLIYGMNAEDALNYCQRVHDTRVSFISVASPQTLKQANQVRRIINNIVKSSN